ncbi:MAG: glycosyltransferase family 4 protein [Nitrospirota bacterium]
MRVLLITGSFPPDQCGVGDYSFNLAKALDSLPEIKIAVLTNCSSAHPASHETFDLFPLIPKWRLSEIGKVIKVIREWTPDIVHIQYPTQGYQRGLLSWFIPLLAFCMGKTVVQTWHEFYRKKHIPQLFLKTIVPGGIIFVRPQYRENLSSFLQWSLWGKKTVQIENASTIPNVVLNQEETHRLRRTYLMEQKRLVIFFGFVYEHKGVEQLFEIANPTTDQIVIAGGMTQEDPYCQKVLRLAATTTWQGKASVKGFLSNNDIAALLSIADAVVLPFKIGGGEWNTSLHAAILQGTFVITTSLNPCGYDTKQNVYYAKPNDVMAMQAALQTYAGKRRPFSPDIDGDPWHQIAIKHQSFYLSVS